MSNDSDTQTVEVPKLLTDSDVGEVLGCSRDVVRRICAEGRLKFIQFGRSRRYRLEWVTEFIEAEAAHKEKVGAGAMIPTARSARAHGWAVNR